MDRILWREKIHDKVASMKRDNLFLVFIGVFISCVFSVPVHADRFQEVAQKARTEFAASQIKWQNDLAELVVQKNPEFRAMANTARDLQLAYTKKRTREFLFLIENEPHCVTLDKGLTSFANYEWTDKNASALIKGDPSYVAFLEDISRLREKNDQNPDWSKFREWFQNTLSKSKEYETLFNDFKERQKGIEALLNQYKPE